MRLDVHKRRHRAHLLKLAAPGRGAALGADASEEDTQTEAAADLEAEVCALAEACGSKVTRIPAGPGRSAQISFGVGPDTDLAPLFQEVFQGIAPGRWWPAPKAQRRPLPARRQPVLVAPRRTRGSGRRSSGRPAGRSATRRSSSSSGDPDPGEPAEEGDGPRPGADAGLVHTRVGRVDAPLAELRRELAA